MYLYNSVVNNESFCPPLDDVDNTNNEVTDLDQTQGLTMPSIVSLRTESFALD